MFMVYFNPHPPKKVVTTPLKIFSLPPQNQKESGLSHLGNLKYIICSHFDEKKMGGKVSHQIWQVGGGYHLRKLKVTILKKNVECMVSKLTVYIKNVISFSEKPGEIPVFKLF